MAALPRRRPGQLAGAAAAVAAVNDGQLAEQDRAHRAGRRLLSDITLETRLRILRDLADHLAGADQITSWAGSPPRTWIA